MALADNALTTLETVLDELGLQSDGGSQDARLERYINAASSVIATHCGRIFQRDDEISEKVAARGGVVVAVSRTPLLSIVSVTRDSQTVSASEYEIHDAEAGLIYRLGGWGSDAATRASLTFPPVPGTERKLITVAYSGGYVTPAQAARGAFSGASRSLPHDLEDACVSLVATRYKSRGANWRLRAENFNDSGYRYGDFFIAPEIAGVLENYRRVSHA